METAYYSFKNHPNFENIKFIVLPKAKEGIDTPCDIPYNVLDSFEEFKSKFPNLEYSDINSYEDPKHFYLEDVDQEFAKNILRNKEESSEDACGSNAFDMIVDCIDKNFSKRLESIRNMVKRTEAVKNRIPQIIKEHSLGKDEKLVIVAHSLFFKVWTAKWDKPLSEYGKWMLLIYTKLDLSVSIKLMNMNLI